MLRTVCGIAAAVAVGIICGLGFVVTALIWGNDTVHAWINQ